MTKRETSGKDWRGRADGPGRHQFTPEERSRGGKTRAAQASMRDARSRGFQTTCWERGYGLWLRKKIKGQNDLRRRKAAMRSLIVQRKARPRRPM
jgi:hypothetical protein